MQKHIRSPFAGGLAAVCAVLALSSLPSQAGLTFSTTFDDPNNTYSAYYFDIQSNLAAAGGLWATHLAGNSSIDVLVRFDPNISTANGASTASSYVGTFNGYNVFQQGAAYEAATGIDPNGAAPDAIITFGSTYLQNTLWFDPNPTLRVDPIPALKVDAVSLMAHELGHVFGFNGWRNLFDGTLPGDYMSTFDQNIFFDGQNFFFNGATSTALHGGPVPLTYGNIFHVGNASPRPGTDLVPDLMNGVVFYYQTRYEISPLDVAMLQDSQVLLIQAVPEPSTWALMLGSAGMLLFVIIRRRRASSVNPCA